MWQSGLADKVGIGHMLDRMLSEVFSNLNDSGIFTQPLCKCGTVWLPWPWSTGWVHSQNHRMGVLKWELRKGVSALGSSGLAQKEL